MWDSEKHLRRQRAFAFGKWARKVCSGDACGRCMAGYTVLFIHESIGIVIKYSCMILCNVNTIVARIIPCMISCMTVAPGV